MKERQVHLNSDSKNEKCMTRVRVRENNSCEVLSPFSLFAPRIGRDRKSKGGNYNYKNNVYICINLSRRGG